MKFKIISIIFVIALFVISYLIYFNHDNDVIAYNDTEVIEKEEIKEKIEEIKKIKIDIKGNIVNPGVYELDEGSRVIDAINIAGGLLESSDTSNINLSKKLKDQNVIIISSIKEEKEPEKVIEYVYIECECPKINDACITNEVVNFQENNEIQETNEDLKENKEEIVSDNIESNNGQVSINNASIEELLTLPGIGESKAKAIINFREENPFTTLEDIKNVSGIGDALFEKIKDFITL